MFKKLGHKGHHEKDEYDRICTLTLTDLNTEYLLKAEEAWTHGWELLNDHDGWKTEAGHGIDKDGLVTSKRFHGTHGKVFRLEGVVEAALMDTFAEVVLSVTESPKWNPTIQDTKILHTMHDTADICYSVTNPIAGGLISSRDFVSTRLWKEQNDIMFSSGCTVHHPEAPPGKKHVRGVNGPGGWAFAPVNGQKDKCRFIWILNTDLKGWLPQSAVDHGCSTSLLQFLHYLRLRMAAVKGS